jgi:phospholipid/cholesterol/gamma-HCH transport system substrate-binding protein
VTLLRQLDPSIGTLLGNLVTTGEIMVRNLAGIRHMLVLYPVAIEVGYTITGGDGRAQVAWVAYPPEGVGADPPRCTYRGDTPVCPPGAGIRAAKNAPAGSRVAASIDPATGLVVTADGRPLLFGETGGQSRLAGSQSWKTLLLNGVTS